VLGLLLGERILWHDYLEVGGASQFAGVKLMQILEKLSVGGPVLQDVELLVNFSL
jgi:hypothetical protein